MTEILPLIDNISALGVLLIAVYMMGQRMTDAREAAERREAKMLDIIARLCDEGDDCAESG